ncbi:MAG: ribulose-phosphate 3-epimerase [Solirubrobacteraceae bacterium]|nr:ribulose-phosphate 3-epimerase [Solirubrobacteraceae bacterium]
MSPLKHCHIAPSILSADLSNLAVEVKHVVDAGAQVIHFDVMDGAFVPPITVGPVVLSALRDALPENVYLDVHLMIENPDRQIEEFARAGADGITFHAEATPHAHRVLHQIREADCRAGLAVCPATSPAVFGEVADLLDLALVMTVNPGWGGQSLIPSTLQKVKAVREILGPDTAIQVDGGVDVDTAPLCTEAGARWLVAGSAVFGADDPGAAYQSIAAAAGV